MIKISSQQEDVIITLLRYTRLKDYDVTWLYGPLETSSGTLVIPSLSPPRTGMSKSCLCINKRPILKKRSVFNLLSSKSLSRDNGCKSPSVLSLGAQSP